MHPAHPVYTIRLRRRLSTVFPGWVTETDLLLPDGSRASDHSPYWPSHDGPFDTRAEAVAWEQENILRGNALEAATIAGI